MKVLGNRLLIQLDDPTSGALIVAPELTRTRADSGTIISRGTGGNLPPELQPGVRVRVDNRYNSVGYPAPEGRSRIYSVSDILAVLG